MGPGSLPLGVLGCGKPFEHRRHLTGGIKGHPIRIRPLELRNWHRESADHAWPNHVCFHRVPNPHTNREIVFESIPERDLAYIALTTPSVADLREQVGPVEYVDENGEIHQHTIDLVADMKSGTSTAFFVKPAERVEPSGIRKTVDFIRSQQPSIANQFCIRTEEHITRDRSANARLLHRALRSRDSDDIAAVLGFANTLRGSMTIRDVLSVTRNDGFGFMALLCLIADGVLEHVGPGRISRNSFVRLCRTTETHL